jgi:hypothetical protein
MKLPALQKLSGVACATLLGATTASAIEINPTLDLTGYIVGSARYVNQDGSDTTLDLDATKVLANIKTTPVSGTVSFFAAGTDDVSILDAFFSWDLGGGTTLSAGKFLSWHGYEAFDIPNMLQITYSNENLEAIIPGYHQGIKFDFAQGASKMGIAFLDGVYDSDSEIDDSFGLEAYYVYSADELTAYFGAAYESGDDDVGGDSLLLDFWLQYVIGSSTLAGEVAFKSADGDDGEGGDADIDSFFASLLYQYAISETSWVVLRACFGEDCFGEDDYDDSFSEDFLKATLALRQKISDNFTIVEEVSFTSFDNADNKTFIGVQGRFTF